MVAMLCEAAPFVGCVLWACVADEYHDALGVVGWGADKCFLQLEGIVSTDTIELLDNQPRHTILLNLSS